MPGRCLRAIGWFGLQPSDALVWGVVVTTVLTVLLVVTSLLLILMILLHKGRGGGLSDMFGGGAASGLGGSSVAERNLDRITIGIGLIWFASIVALGLMMSGAA